MTGVLRGARDFGRLIRLSHTVFGLPFCLAAAAIADRFSVAAGDTGLDWIRLLWITVAFTGARAFAMGFNRIVDRNIDAANPRTADREIPRGVISVRAAWVWTATSAAVFVAAAGALGTLALSLSPLCLVVLAGYSLFKRFSWSSHLMLGLALALAPGGAWVAVTGGVSGWPVPLCLMAAVATWVAGFDILYALADIDFDRKTGLHSIPARFGIPVSLGLSAALHGLTVVALLAVHHLAGLGGPHLVGVAGIGVVLVVEHVIVRPGDLSRLGRAFFDLNGYVSVGYLLAVAVDLFVWPLMT